MMANPQFYFAIGLPIFSILLVWLGSTVANNRAIDGLGKRIDDLGKSLNQRIDGLENGLKQRIEDQGQKLGKRIEDLDRSLNQRMDDLDRGLNLRIDDLRSEMRAGFQIVNERLARIEVRLDHVEDEVRKDHESRLSRLEARVFTSAA